MILFSGVSYHSNYSVVDGGGGIATVSVVLVIMGA